MADASRFLFNHRRTEFSPQSIPGSSSARELGLRCAFGEDSAQECVSIGVSAMWILEEEFRVPFARMADRPKYTGQCRPIARHRYSLCFRQFCHSVESLERVQARQLGPNRLEGGLRIVAVGSEEWHESLSRLARAESSASIAADGHSRLLSQIMKLLYLWIQLRRFWRGDFSASRGCDCRTRFFSSCAA